MALQLSAAEQLPVELSVVFMGLLAVGLRRAASGHPPGGRLHLPGQEKPLGMGASQGDAGHRESSPPPDAWVPGALLREGREIWCAGQGATAPAGSHSAPDELSVKGSGNRDSECNDCDSEASSEGQQKAPAEGTEKQRGNPCLVQGRELQLCLSSRSLLCHHECRDAASYSVARTNSPLPQTRKMLCHPELSTQSEADSSAKPKTAECL